MAEPTAQEILLWSMINRARLNPAGEAARYGIDLNEGLSPGTISTASKQPLAYSAALFASADAHSQAMIDRDFFAHNDPQTGSTPQSRGNAAGYAGGVGENIAWRGSTGPIDATTTIITQHQDLFVDAGVSGRGHRTNMLSDNYKEVGVGQVLGGFTSNGTTYNASMVTEDFGVPSAATQFLLGAAFNDTNGDGAYSVGEGRASVSISIGGASTSTGAAGAYSAAASSGDQFVVFSGGGLSSPVSLTATITAGRNGLINLIGTSTIETSISLTAQAGVVKIIGLGNAPLSLTGNALDNIIVSALGNDAINGGDGTDTVVYSGNQSAYTLTFDQGGTRITGPDGTDTLTSVERLQFRDGTVTLSTPQPLQDSYIFQSGDFNADNRTDLLWIRDDRTISVWDSGNLANAHTVANAGSFPAGWKIVGIGDFDGNNRDDFLWRSDSGAVSIWDNGAIGGAHTIAQAGQVPSNWNIVSVGDFDANGKSDILWQRADGALSIWDNGAMSGAHIIVQAGQVPTSWHVVTTGDFDANGKSDILWRNDNGAVSIWDNGAIGGAHIIAQAGQVSSNWTILGTGDFDGNGKSDILWQRSDGAVSIWDNGAISGAHIIVQPGQVASSWHIANIGDFDGNGKSDIAWRNDDGRASVWDDGAIGNAHVIANSGAVPNGWHIV